MQCSVYAYNLYNYENYTIFIHDFKAFLLDPLLLASGKCLRATTHTLVFPNPDLLVEREKNVCVSVSYANNVNTVLSLRDISENVRRNF
ncbi:hypothetical protein AD947_03680 [Acetobacter tropicalis]|uniref:Uncharacterized protein n=1 Tax=Acetobacter tropicalis TaxID=104102 RepID=A0A149U2S1_9PROT|nr:hypothetical protein AD947_03680 [Acetobacter tropicalis]